jgi:hypothetical protein
MDIDDLPPSDEMDDSASARTSPSLTKKFVAQGVSMILVNLALMFEW